MKTIKCMEMPCEEEQTLVKTRECIVLRSKLEI